jgi:tRNA dimethylallyltransferase
VNHQVPLLLGPTASGKTALALRWSRETTFGRPIEIISVDSALVYRGMDIGTAKPSAQELAEIPHHLIDIIDPAERFSAAQFVNAVDQLVPEIFARGHQPVLVGGTMLYARSLLFGIDDLPPANAQLRAQIDQEAAQLGWPALHAQLHIVDPRFAAGIAPQDSQRIQRALEVFRLTGQPMSSFFGRGAQQQTAARQWQPQLQALLPENRVLLHQRIAERFEQMLVHGLIDEVKTLKARPDLHPGLPSMRCVGYRQVWEYLDGPQTKADYLGMRDKGIAATRQLAKRQITWLRSLTGTSGLLPAVPAS